MLKFRITIAVFLVLLAGLIAGKVAGVLPFFGWGLFLLLLAFSIVLFYGSYYVGSGFYMPVSCAARTDKKQIAISFDDGPADNYTLQVLAALEAHQVPAAFFCIGKRAETNKELLKRIHAAGHIIGNHSYSHSAVFDLFGTKKMYDDLQQMNAVVHQTLGLQPRLFRPPYGVTNPNLARAVRKSGFTAVGWNIRSLDTVIKDKDRLLRKVRKALKPGAVILFHDTCKSTAEMLPAFIREARAAGYEIVRLDKLLHLVPYAADKK